MVGKRGFSMHCLGLKYTHHPHVMVLIITHVTKRWDDKIIPTLGFMANFLVPAVGYTGGICILWDPTVEVLDSSAQSVHTLISFNRPME